MADEKDQQLPNDAELSAFASQHAQGPASPSGNYDELINRKAQQYGVDPSLVRAMVHRESGANPNAVSKRGAQGLMQLMPDTAASLGVTDPTDPEQNVDGGTRYIKQLLDANGGNVERALAAYNAGPGAVKKYGGVPPYQETQDYVKRITGKMQGSGLPDDASLAEFAQTVNAAPDAAKPEAYSGEMLEQQRNSVIAKLRNRNLGEAEHQAAVDELRRLNTELVSRRSSIQEGTGLEHTDLLGQGILLAQDTRDVPKEVFSKLYDLAPNMKWEDYPRWIQDNPTILGALEVARGSGKQLAADLGNRHDEYAQQVAGETPGTIPQGDFGKSAMGVAEHAEKTQMEMLADPLMWPFMFLSGPLAAEVRPLVRTGVDAVFATQMGVGAMQALGQSYQELDIHKGWDSQSPEFYESLKNGGTQALFALMATGQKTEFAKGGEAKPWYGKGKEYKPGEVMQSGFGVRDQVAAVKAFGQFDGRAQAEYGRPWTELSPDERSQIWDTMQTEVAKGPADEAAKLRHIADQLGLDQKNFAKFTQDKQEKAEQIRAEREAQRERYERIYNNADRLLNTGAQPLDLNLPRDLVDIQDGKVVSAQPGAEPVDAQDVFRQRQEARARGEKADEIIANAPEKRAAEGKPTEIGQPEFPFGDPAQMTSEQRAAWRLRQEERNLEQKKQDALKILEDERGRDQEREMKVTDRRRITPEEAMAGLQLAPLPQPETKTENEPETKPFEQPATSTNQTVQPETKPDFKEVATQYADAIKAGDKDEATRLAVDMVRARRAEKQAPPPPTPVAATPEPPPPLLAAGEPAQAAAPEGPAKKYRRTDEDLQRAKDVIKRFTSGQQLNTGLDPEILGALVDIGVYHFERGAEKFTDWSRNVIKEVGEWAKPHLRGIYTATKKIITDERVEASKPQQAAPKLEDIPGIEHRTAIARRESALEDAAGSLHKAATVAPNPEEAARLAAAAVEAQERAQKLAEQRREDARQALAQRQKQTDQPVGQPVQVFAQGKDARVKIPGTDKSFDVQYAVVSAESLIPSHNPKHQAGEWEQRDNAFQPRTSYGSDRGKQQGIIFDAQNIQTDEIHSDSPTQELGPPTVRRDGLVAGGNGRVMRELLAYQSGYGDVIHDDLIKQAAKFGINPDQIPPVTEFPILVRILKQDITDRMEMHRLGDELNVGSAAGMTTEERGVAAAKMLTEDQFGIVVEMLSGGTTIRELMTAKNDWVRDLMRRSGMIEPTKESEFINPENGKLTTKGKDLFEDAIFGRVVPDAELMKEARLDIPGVLNKLDRSLSVLARVQGNADRVGQEWSIQQFLMDALRLHIRIRKTADEFNDFKALIKHDTKAGRNLESTDSHVEWYLHPDRYSLTTGSLMFEGGSHRDVQINPAVEAVAKLLERDSTTIKNEFEQFAKEAESMPDPGQAGFGFGEGDKEPWEEFTAAIGRPNGVEVDSDAWFSIDRPKPAEGEAAPAVQVAPKPVKAEPRPPHIFDSIGNRKPGAGGLNVIPEQDVAARPTRDTRETLLQERKAAVERIVELRNLEKDADRIARLPEDADGFVQAAAKDEDALHLFYEVTHRADDNWIPGQGVTEKQLQAIRDSATATMQVVGEADAKLKYLDEAQNEKFIPGTGKLKEPAEVAQEREELLRRYAAAGGDAEIAANRLAPIEDLRARVAGMESVREGDIKREEIKKEKSEPPAPLAVVEEKPTPAPLAEAKPKKSKSETTPRSDEEMDLRDEKKKLTAQIKHANTVDGLAEYFQPGKIVEGYGGPDKVISFNRVGSNDWTVSVIRVNKDGSAVAGEEVRTHHTRPSLEQLAPGAERKLRLVNEKLKRIANSRPAQKIEPPPAEEPETGPAKPEIAVPYGAKVDTTPIDWKKEYPPSKDILAAIENGEDKTNFVLRDILYMTPIQEFQKATAKRQIELLRARVQGYEGGVKDSAEAYERVRSEREGVVGEKLLKKAGGNMDAAIRLAFKHGGPSPNPYEGSNTEVFADFARKLRVYKEAIKFIESTGEPIRDLKKFGLKDGKVFSPTPEENAADRKLQIQATKLAESSKLESLAKHEFLEAVAGGQVKSPSEVLDIAEASAQVDGKDEARSRNVQEAVQFGSKKKVEQVANDEAADPMLRDRSNAILNAMEGGKSAYAVTDDPKDLDLERRRERWVRTSDKNQAAIEKAAGGADGWANSGKAKSVAHLDSGDYLVGFSPWRTYRELVRVYPESEWQGKSVAYSTRIKELKEKFTDNRYWHTSLVPRDEWRGTEIEVRGKKYVIGGEHEDVSALSPNSKADEEYFARMKEQAPDVLRAIKNADLVLDANHKNEVYVFHHPDEPDVKAIVRYHSGLESVEGVKEQMLRAFDAAGVEAPKDVTFAPEITDAFYKKAIKIIREINERQFAEYEQRDSYKPDREYYFPKEGMNVPAPASITKELGIDDETYGQLEHEMYKRGDITAGQMGQVNRKKFGVPDPYTKEQVAKNYLIGQINQFATIDRYKDFIADIKRMQQEGATDAELRSVLSSLMTTQGGGGNYNGPHTEYKGGNSPVFSVDKDFTDKKPTFNTAALVDLLREIGPFPEKGKESGGMTPTPNEELETLKDEHEQLMSSLEDAENENDAEGAKEIRRQLKDVESKIKDLGAAPQVKPRKLAPPPSEVAPPKLAVPAKEEPVAEKVEKYPPDMTPKEAQKVLDGTKKRNTSPAARIEELDGEIGQYEGYINEMEDVLSRADAITQEDSDLLFERSDGEWDLPAGQPIPADVRSNIEEVGIGGSKLEVNAREAEKDKIAKAIETAPNTPEPEPKKLTGPLTARKLKEQLKAAFPNVSDIQHDALLDLWKMRAKKLGMTLDEFATKYVEAAIKDGDPGAAALKQQWQTDSPQFKRWFGDSKVVDENGQPLVVFHGTDKNFSMFSHEAPKERLHKENAFFFSDHPAIASSYATGEGGTVLPVYLSIKNLKDINGFDEETGTPHSLWNVVSDATIARAKADGYDGIVVRNTSDRGANAGDTGPTDVYIAFEPTQIKSAIGNIGEFDPNNPNILFQKGLSDEIEELVKKGGGEPVGLQLGTKQTGNFVLFNDPTTGSTLAVREDSITPENVSTRIAAHREEVKAYAAAALLRANKDILYQQDGVRFADIYPKESDVSRARESLIQQALERPAVVQALREGIRDLSTYEGSDDVSRSSMEWHAGTALDAWVEGQPGPFSEDTMRKIVRTMDPEDIHHYANLRMAYLSSGEDHLSPEWLGENDTLYQRGAGNKGAAEFLPNGKAIIHGFESGDVSTLVHETAHIFRRTLVPEELEEAEKIYKIKNGKWSVDAEEKFARDFERYLYDGDAPTPALRRLFNQFKDWMRSIYTRLIASPIEDKLSPEKKAFFAKMLGVTDADINQAREARIASAGKMPTEAVTTLSEAPTKAAEAPSSTPGPPSNLQLPDTSEFDKRMAARREKEAAPQSSLLFGPDNKPLSMAATPDRASAMEIAREAARERRSPGGIILPPVEEMAPTPARERPNANKQRTAPNASPEPQERKATGGGAEPTARSRSAEEMRESERRTQGERTELADSRRAALKKVDPILMAPSERPRGPGVYKAESWANRLHELNLPDNAPVPTRRLDPDIAAKLMPGQPEAVEMALSGLDQHDGFVMATSTGTGKTYIASAVLAQDKPKLALITTKNQTLVDEWIKTARDHFGVEVKRLPKGDEVPREGIYITTIATARDHDGLKVTPWDMYLADESGEFRRWYQSGQGVAGSAIADSAKKALFLSATPFHSPLELGYLGKLGLWRGSTFDEFAKQFGVRKDSDGNWIAPLNPRRMAKLREQLIERGQFVNMDRNMEGFHADFGVVRLSPAQRQQLNNAARAFDLAERYYTQMKKSSMIRATKGNAVTFIKNFLERARLDQAIALGKQYEKKGWKVIYMTENKSEVPVPFDFLMEADKAMGGKISELWPALPSVSDKLKEAFGDDIADFSGAHSAARTEEKNDFTEGRKKHLYATYAAGGVGVSLHDTVGDAPRAVIYLGLPWSGVMFDQAVGRPWRFGTKSDVHAVFLASDTEPEMRLIAEKIGPRLESLRAGVSGIHKDDPIVRAMTSIDGALDYDQGGAHSAGSTDAFNKSISGGIQDWKEIKVRDSSEAKNKGMQMPNSDIELNEPDRGGTAPPPPKQPSELPRSLLFQQGHDQQLSDMGNKVRKLVRSNIAPRPDAEPIERGAAAAIAPARDVIKESAEGIGTDQVLNHAIDSATENAKGVDGDPTPAMIGGMKRDLVDLGVPNDEMGSDQKRETFIDQYVTHIRAILRKVGGEMGNDIANKVASYQAKRLNIAGLWQTALQDVVDQHGLGKSEGAMTKAILTVEGRSPEFMVSHVMAEKQMKAEQARKYLETTPLQDAEIEKAAPKLREIMGEVADVAKQYGVQVESRNGSGGFDYHPFPERDAAYMPHRYTPEVYDRGSKQREAIIEQLMAQGRTKREAEDMLQTRTGRSTALAGNLERAREGDVLGYRTDLMSLYGYLTDAAEAVARTQEFGQRREYLTGMTAQIDGPEARETIHRLLDIAVGRNPKTEEQSKWNRYSANWAVVSKMAFSALPIIGQGVSEGLRTNGRATVLSLGKIMKELATGGYKDEVRSARLAGVLWNQVRLEFQRQAGTNTRVADKYLDWIGVNDAHAFSRVWANANVSIYLERYALPELMANGSSADFYKRNLRDHFGLSDKDIAEAVENGEFSDQQVRHAQAYSVSDTQYSGDPSTMPPAWVKVGNDTTERALLSLFKMATVLRSYSYKQAVLLKSALVHEAMTDVEGNRSFQNMISGKGNYRPWVVFAMLMPVIGELLGDADDMVRNATAIATGRKQSRLEEMLDGDHWNAPWLAKRWAGDIGHVGGLGLTGRLIDSVSSNHAADAILGANISDAIRTAYLPIELFKAKNSSQRQAVIEHYLHSTLPATKAVSAK